jgi:hypothetical protein
MAASTFFPVRVYKCRSARRPTWYWVAYIGTCGELLCDELGRARRFLSSDAARTAGLVVLRSRQEVQG